MARFTDAKQRDWEIRIDAPTALRIRQECDPEFLLNDFREDKPNTFARLMDDAITLCRVIFCLCDRQRQERGVDEASFYEGLAGDAIARATSALLEAITSFSPPRTREVLEAFVRQDDLRHKAVLKVLERVTAPDLQEKALADLDRRLDEAIKTQLKSATDSPESAESTQPA